MTDATCRRRSSGSYPVQWTGRHAVVALPEHIDVYNARPIREELLSIINRGAKALIADMSVTHSQAKVDTGNQNTNMKRTVPDAR